jgi:hypothetical protein
VAEIHVFNPKNPTTANNIIRIKNRNRICLFFQFQFSNIRNKKINQQYNKNNHRQLRDNASFCIASISGKIALTIKLNANNDQTNKKLVHNNFREIFLCCLEKIC